jgi:hypothetical protein
MKDKREFKLESFDFSKCRPNFTVSSILSNLGNRAYNMGSCRFADLVSFLERTMNPRGFWVSLSIDCIESYSKAMSTQCGGYLNRAVSNKSTFSASRLNPPIGQKCPSPVWSSFFLLTLTICKRPSVREEAYTAVWKSSRLDW